MVLIWNFANYFSNSFTLHFLKKCLIATPEMKSKFRPHHQALWGLVTEFKAEWSWYICESWQKEFGEFSNNFNSERDGSKFVLLNASARRGIIIKTGYSADYLIMVKISGSWTESQISFSPPFFSQSFWNPWHEIFPVPTGEQLFSD